MRGAERNDVRYKETSRMNSNSFAYTRACAPILPELVAPRALGLAKMRPAAKCRSPRLESRHPRYWFQRTTRA